MDMINEATMTCINLSFSVRYPEGKPLPEGWIRIEIEDHIKEWMEVSNIKYQFSLYGNEVYFETEEDRVKFILRWL